jgi:hypothetical protein
VLPDAFCISIPALIKASSVDGRRIIEVQASSQDLDGEGDVILQQALLNSAKSFLAKGVIDVDHLSEIGHRVPGLPMPPSYYICGKPLEVIDLGAGCTSVKCELFQFDKNNPATAKAEEIWNSITTTPPVPWRASIFGYPTDDGYIDVRACKSGSVETYGATRYLVSKMLWKSLALTRRPVNDSLTGTARIVTEKALAKALSTFKSYAEYIETGSPSGDFIANNMLAPRTREELKGAHWVEHIKKGRCPHAGGSMGNSIVSFREHFTTCCMMDPWQADLTALALMYLLKRESSST